MGKYKKRKDGRYATSVTLGHDANGKVIKVFLSAKTEKELRNKIVELKMKMKTGEAIKTSDTLLRDYADSWMDTYKTSASINTKAMYKNAVEKHIKPELGHLPINKIVRSDVQKLINDNQEHPRTCEIIKMTLVQIFNSAIDDKLLHENVAKKATPPKRHKAEKRALTDLEKEAIKKAMIYRICGQSVKFYDNLDFYVRRKKIRDYLERLYKKIEIVLLDRMEMTFNIEK